MVSANSADSMGEWMTVHNSLTDAQDSKWISSIILFFVSVIAC